MRRAAWAGDVITCAAWVRNMCCAICCRLAAGAAGPAAAVRAFVNAPVTTTVVTTATAMATMDTDTPMRRRRPRAAPLIFALRPLLLACFASPLGYWGLPPPETRRRRPAP